MPRKSHQAVSIPGVTSFSSAEADGRAPDDDVDGDAVGLSPEAEIAKLRAQLAAKDVELERAKAASTKVLASVVFEPETPHGAEARRLSSHNHLTSAQLTAMIKAGEVELTQRHVLCSDGWYVNPKFA